MFDPILVLLSMEEDPVFEKEDYKKYVLGALGSYRLKMMFVLLTEIITLYIQVSIVRVWIPCFEWPIKGIFSRL